MKVGHGTLTTGKILRSGYLGNGCHGDGKIFPILKYSLDWPKNSAFPSHYFFFNFGQIPTKFGMKVGHWTLTTGKILRSGYLGNGCHGDEKIFPILKYSLDWPKNVPGRSIMDRSKIMA